MFHMCEKDKKKPLKLINQIKTTQQESKCMTKTKCMTIFKIHKLIQQDQHKIDPMTIISKSRQIWHVTGSTEIDKLQYIHSNNICWSTFNTIIIAYNCTM